MKWLSESETTEFVVNRIIRTNSGKGFILEGEEDKAFLWNSDNVLKQLLVALAAWCDTGEGKGLKVVRNTAQKRGFDVVPVLIKGKPVATNWKHIQTGYSCCQEVEETNPFL